MSRSVVRFEIAPRTIAWLVASIALVWLFLKLWPIALLVVVALVFVGTLNPLVAQLERRGFRRGPALLIIFLALVVALSLLLLSTVPPLVRQLIHMVDDAPAQRERLIGWLQERKLTTPLAEVVRDAGSEELFSRAGRYILGYSSQVVRAIGYGVTTLFLAFYLLADGKRAQGALYAVVPRDYHLRLARILLNLETIVGGYMRGQLITSGAIAVFMFVLLTACQVPNALALAVFAGLTDVIPFIGGLLATTPAVLAALPRGLGVTLVVLIAAIVYQEFENRILVPRVYGRVLRLSAPTVIVALLIGGTLLGILGALLALPIAAGLHMIVRELRVELPGDDTDDRVLRARDEKAERKYERLSAGSPPQEAGVIANELAQAIRQADAATPEEAALVPITGGLPGPDADKQ